MLLHGDCLELMPTLASQSIDLILCDLPYGTTRCKWDSVIPLEALWSEYRRLIKSNGAIVLTAQQPFSTVLTASNLKMLRYEWIWEKHWPTGYLNARKMPLKSHEQVLVFYSKLPTYNPQMTVGKPYRSTRSAGSGRTYGKAEVIETVNHGSRYPRDILKFEHDRAPNQHPTQKPVALMEYMIRTYTNPGDVVLDNCLGSGTTAVAAINTGRKWVGIEREAEYVEMAQSRIAAISLA